MRRPVSTPERGSGCRLAVKRCALGPAARPAGDGGAEHPLGGGQVEPGARPVRDADGDVVLEAAVAGGVVGDAVLPAAPEHAAPSAPEGADGARVVVSARERGGVAVGGPRVPVAGAGGGGAACGAPAAGAGGAGR